eukprot:sb/3461570/
MRDIQYKYINPDPKILSLLSFTTVPLPGNGNTVGYAIIHENRGSDMLQFICEGAREDMDKLKWYRNGELMKGNTIDNEYSPNIREVHVLMNDNDATYECNGIKFDYVTIPASEGPQEVSIWQGLPIVCIDKEYAKYKTELTNEAQDTKIIAPTTMGDSAKFWQILQYKVDSTMTIKCNGTEDFTFKSETVPVTKLEFKSKEVICTCTDPEARCTLQIFLKDKMVAEEKAQFVSYKYKSINIAQVRCEAKCDIGEESIVLPVKNIEVNRTLFIVVIFIIILIILIVIIMVCCVLWHQFGFKEKYGYQINMRLNKQFNVGDNKLSSYRLSGVQPDGPLEEEKEGEDQEGDITKEFMDDGSMEEDESFTDPNFARGNGEKDIDYESKGAEVEVKQPRTFFFSRMLPRKFGTSPSLKVAVQRSLSQKKLYVELAKTGLRPELLPKTYPFEVREASIPPVTPDKRKDEIDQKVLEALVRAGEKSKADGQPVLPTKEIWEHNHGKGRSINAEVDSGMDKIRQAGQGLAEQFIMKYPESFKVRFSDNVSRSAECTWVQGLCRDLKIDQLHEVMREVHHGTRQLTKDDFEVLIKFFGKHNSSAFLNEWPIVVDEVNGTAKYLWDSKGKRFEKLRGPIDSSSYKGYLKQAVKLPYCKSLLKTVDVECRNVVIGKQRLIEETEDLALSTKEKENFLEMMMLEKFKYQAYTTPGLGGDKYMRARTEKLIKAGQRDARQTYARDERHNATLPKEGSTTFVSVASNRSYCYLLLQQMIRDGLEPSAEAYSAVIQSCVKFYNPDLAWNVYELMRSNDVYPTNEALCDLLYSITHAAEPEDFVSPEVQQKLVQLLTDLKTNPDSTVTDEMFLYLFYGVHQAPERNAKRPSPGDLLSDPSKIVPDVPESVGTAISKYNYQILFDMIALLKAGSFKLSRNKYTLRRFSTAYKMLVMHNLTVGGGHKTKFSRDFTTAIYNLSVKHPDVFERLPPERCPFTTLRTFILPTGITSNTCVSNSGTDRIRKYWSLIG